jgi:hypothetical protein
MQDDSYRSVYKYSVNVNDKRTFTLNQNRENEPLRMFDNGKRTQAQVNGTAINSFEEETNEVQAGKEEKIFENGNIYGVTNGPTNETQFFIEQKTLVTRIQNYHYFNYGAKPGFIGLVDARGKRYGPWQAIGLPGQGNVQNAYWEIEPNIVLPPGIYTVVDSDPSTWSVNPQSGGRGFTSVWGILY